MRTTTPRLTAALTTIALGASLAAPGVQGAAATSVVPSVPDVTGALTAAGISTANASSILAELQNLQSQGGALPAGGLSTLESSFGGLLGPVLQTALNLLNLLGSPGTPANITSLLNDLQSGSASAPAPVKAAVAELQAALTTAGLGQLLTLVPSLTALQNTSALSALAGLQTLPLAGNIPTGSLAPVATVLTTLAAAPGVSATPAAATLTTAAGTLSASNPITPTALLGVIGQLQGLASGTGALPAPLNGVASALAAQLGDSSSILGGLSSLGNPPSASSITNALAALSALPGLPAGGTLPAGSLAPVAGILTTIAGEPGVSGTPIATTLTNAAAVLSNPTAALNPAQLSTLITLLQGAASSLPAPLGGPGGAVTGIVARLADAGTLLGIPAGTGTTGGSTGSAGSTGATGGTTTGTTGTGQTGGTKPAGSTGRSTAHGGTLQVLRAKRAGQTVTVALRCTASASRSCTGNLTASGSGYATARRSVRLAGASARTVTVKLRARGRAARHNRHRSAIRVAVRSGSYHFSRTLK